MALTLTASAAAAMTKVALANHLEANLAHLQWQIQVAAKAGRHNTRITVPPEISHHLVEIVRQQGFSVSTESSKNRTVVIVSWLK